jgi:uncharacterized surface protein with fasciclin (FAS1) repeats
LSRAVCLFLACAACGFAEPTSAPSTKPGDFLLPPAPVAEDELVEATAKPATQPVQKPSNQTLAALLKRHNSARFLELMDRAGMSGVLAGPNAVTVFVPNDAAFEKLPDPVKSAVKSGDPLVLRKLLAGHITWGNAAYTKMGPTAAVRMVLGNTIFMQKMGVEWSVAKARVLFGDQPAETVTVHIVDAVLLPPRWSSVDAREIATDSSIAMSGPDGGMVHAATCPLGGGVAATPRASAPSFARAADMKSPAAPGTNGGKSAQTQPAKPTMPTGPRGGGLGSTMSAGDPTYDPNDKAPEEKDKSRGEASNPVADATTPGVRRGPIDPNAACTCGLLPIK